MTTMVLVHGAFHGSWCFDPLLPELTERGIDTVTVDLPLTSLSADAAVVTEALDRCDGPVVLLGHSYGGAVITVAGTHPAVDQLVYLTAMAPDSGGTASEGPVEIGPVFMAALQVSSDGRLEVDPAQAAAVFYPDADPATGAAFADKLRPGSTGGDDLVPSAAWREKPTSYVVCTDDPILLPEAQRAIAARTGAAVVEMAGDHSPFVARPAELADLLVRITA
jgi:pimeloyl-ACP methyl ester carboxylesterase